MKFFLLSKKKCLHHVCIIFYNNQSFIVKLINIKFLMTEKRLKSIFKIKYFYKKKLILFFLFIFYIKLSEF